MPRVARARSTESPANAAHGLAARRACSGRCCSSSSQSSWREAPAPGSRRDTVLRADLQDVPHGRADEPIRESAPGGSQGREHQIRPGCGGSPPGRRASARSGPNRTPGTVDSAQLPPLAGVHARARIGPRPRVAGDDRQLRPPPAAALRRGRPSPAATSRMRRDPRARIDAASRRTNSRVGSRLQGAARVELAEIVQAPPRQPRHGGVPARGSRAIGVRRSESRAGVPGRRRAFDLGKAIPG